MKRPLSDWEKALQKQAADEKAENIANGFIAIIKFSCALTVAYVIIHFVVKFW